METVTDFIFEGSKITLDADYSQEIKRPLLLGRNAAPGKSGLHERGEGAQQERDAFLPQPEMGAASLPGEFSQPQSPLGSPGPCTPLFVFPCHPVT